MRVSRIRRQTHLLASLASLVSLAIIAVAPHTANAADAEPAPTSPKRALPDYDGRGNPEASSSPALWVPRVLLSPAYLVSEYGIRRPLGFLISSAERAGLPGMLY